jgi:vanillate O-demethylase monooxygenase subunit
VHSTSIGQQEIDETPCTTRREGEKVVTSRFMENIEAPPFWRDALSTIVEGNPKVDRWQICRFSPPSHVLIEVGVAVAGHGGYDAPDDKKVYSVVTDFITPEVDGSMWYFWGMARRFRPQDTELTDRIREGQGGIFSEDLEVLERQQQNLDAFAQRKLLKLNIDAGGVQARRVIEEHIAQEVAA